MANTLIRMVPKVRTEAKTGLGTGSNTAYMLHLESEDKAKEFYLLWGSGDPSTDYDTAPAGSFYADYSGNGQLFLKNVATGWTEQT